MNLEVCLTCKHCTIDIVKDEKREVDWCDWYTKPCHEVTICDAYDSALDTAVLDDQMARKE